MYVLVALLLIAATVMAACGGAKTAKKSQQPEDKLEIFSWWTTGGEAAGLNALYKLYHQKYPNVKIINATVAGGAGSNAKAVLASRMQGGDPPDSFQVHMGHELIDTWVVAGKMEPLDDLYKEEGWEKVFPKGVLKLLSYKGHYYSVPTNIHRANMLWYNKKIFADNGLQPPKTFDDFFKVADALKAKGITPLALGDSGIWASKHLFETVLLGELGPDGYKGLWTGKTDWNGEGVKKSLEIFKKMLTYANSDHAALSWDQANELVLDGKAAMTIMGDWVDADNLAKKKYGVEGWVASPNTDGVYDALSDTFGLPKGAKHPVNARNWLRLIGSREGQDAFNPLKGSIPARTDAGKGNYTPYLKWAMKEWEKDTIVPSLTHGAAASPSWNTTIDDIMTAFVTDGNVEKAQAALAKACVDAGVCKK